MSHERIPAIIGLGAARGRNLITNEMLDAEMGRKPGTIDTMMRRTGAGIETRFRVDTGEPVSNLALEAITQAIEMARITKEDLTTVVIATSSPDRIASAAAAKLQYKLGIEREVETYDLSAACPGWVHVLKNSMVDLTSYLGQGGAHAAIGAEVTSIGMSNKRPLVKPLFGDAAGATIVALVKPDDGAPTGIGFSFGTKGEFYETLGVAAGGSEHPATHETVEERQHDLAMDDPKLVADYAVPSMAERSKEALKKANISIEEIDLFIPHQANERIMRDAADAAGIPQNKVFVTVDRYGNTSAASIPSAMWEAWNQGVMKRNMIVAGATFGAGFNSGAFVLPMVGLPER